MTNVTAGAYADIPLFLFHLLEYMDVDYTIDVDEINERWRELAAVDVWAQLIMKEPTDSVERILDGAADRHLAPARGRQADVRPGHQRLARGHPRGRVLLPACLRRRATTGSRVPTSASWSPRDGCRPPTASPSAAAATSTASARMYKSEPPPDPPTVMPIGYVK